MRNLILISWNDLKNLIRSFMWSFYALVFPIALISILGFLTNSFYGENFSSYDYYGITMLIYFITINCSFAANSFLEERIKKPNMRIIYSPGRDSYIYLSKIIASFIFCTVSNIITLGFMHYFLGVYINGLGALLTIIVLLNLLSVSFGVLMCCMLKSEMAANTVQTTIINVFAVFAGVWFPMEGFGNTMKTISNLSPTKWIINLVFSIIHDNDYSKFPLAVVVLIILIVLTISLCKLTFKKEEFI